MATEIKLRQKPNRATGSEPGAGLVDVARFEYPEGASPAFVPTWEGWDDPGGTHAAGGFATPNAASAVSGPVSGSSHGLAQDPADSDAQGTPSKSQDADADLARLLGEERERAFDTGYEAGFEAGRRKGTEETREVLRSAGTQAEERRNAQVARALESFAGEREKYLQSVEQEVVRLALAVAARILRREAAVDPLLLSGAVRVALGQIAASTGVKLRVPAAELGLWKEAMAAVPNLAARPAVVAGEGMQLGDCGLETALGRADLGIGAQLAEVERVLLEEPALAGASLHTVQEQEKIKQEQNRGSAA